MKQLLLITAFVFGLISTNAQDITNTLGTAGKFTVSSPEATGTVSSTVNLFGSVAGSTRSVSESFTFGENDNTIYVSSGNVTGILPNPANAEGRTYLLHRASGSSVTLTGGVTDMVLDNINALYTIIRCIGSGTGAEWKVETIVTNVESSYISSYSTNVREFVVVEDGDTFTFEEDDQLIHLSGEKKKIVCNLPAATDVSGRIYGISLADHSVKDVHITFKTTGGLINGKAEIKDLHAPDIVYFYIYNDGTDWWILAWKGHEVKSLSIPITFKADASLGNYNDTYYEANFTGDNHQFIITLTSAVDDRGKEYTLKRNTDANTYSGNSVTLLTINGEKIDGVATYVLDNNYESVTIKSNGTMWVVVNSHNH